MSRLEDCQGNLFTAVYTVGRSLSPCPFDEAHERDRMKSRSVNRMLSCGHTFDSEFEISNLDFVRQFPESHGEKRRRGA